MKVLFLCTDNYTRSISAEFCLINYLKNSDITDIEAASAGFKANSDLSKFSSIHFDRMNEIGVDTSAFERTQFKEEFFDEYDVIVGMGMEHKDYLLKKYNKKIYLFNEIFKNEKKSVVVPPPDEEWEYLEKIKSMVDYINNVMPRFVENLYKITKTDNDL